MTNQNLIDALNYVKKKKVFFGKLAGLYVNGKYCLFLKKISFQTENLNVRDSEIDGQKEHGKPQFSLSNLGDISLLSKFGDKFKNSAKGIWNNVQSMIPGQEKVNFGGDDYWKFFFKYSPERLEFLHNPSSRIAVRRQELEAE